jgi:hypothetical protein
MFGSFNQLEIDQMKVIPYVLPVGSLMHAQVCTLFLSGYFSD